MPRGDRFLHDDAAGVADAVGVVDAAGVADAATCGGRVIGEARYQIAACVDMASCCHGIAIKPHDLNGKPACMRYMLLRSARFVPVPKIQLGPTPAHPLTSSGVLASSGSKLMQLRPGTPTHCPHRA